MNTPLNSQFDTNLNISSNVNDVHLDNMSQVLTTTPIITPLATTSSMNENQLIHIQDHQQVIHSGETSPMSEVSFYYAPNNDFQIYHINCKEISFDFEGVSQLIDNTDNNMIDNYVQSNKIFVFYHKQPEIKKIYQVTCEMVSHTTIFQFLNKTVYDIQFVNCEHHQQVFQDFSKKHQENLKFHLKNNLIHYLMPKNI